MPDRLALNEWLAARSYEAIRYLESPQPAVHPDGRRLRGIELARRLVLTRDRKLYTWSLIEGIATELDTATVMRLFSLDDLRAGYERAVNAYRQRVARSPGLDRKIQF